MSRHWLVGSGASLKETPLELLNNEITWGMNRIHLFCGETSWRPTYYFMVDHNTKNPPEYWKEAILAHRNTEKWLWEVFRDGFPKGHPNFEDIPEGLGDLPNTHWIPRCKEHHYYMGNNHVKRAESWHLPEICTAFSGMGAMMQLAVMNGATEIYLVGCDNYGPDYSKNHMVERYSEDEDDRSELDNTNMNHLHTVARRSSPIPIFNATVGGNLEVHPRRDIFEVLDA